MSRRLRSKSPPRFHRRNRKLHDLCDPEYHFRARARSRVAGRGVGGGIQTGPDKRKLSVLSERRRDRPTRSSIEATIRDVVRATRDFREFRERLFVIQTFTWYYENERGSMPH